MVSLQPLCEEGHLNIKWVVSDNGGSDIINYIVRWWRDSEQPESNLLAVSRNSELTQQGGNYLLTGLDSDATYNVEVEATNGVGTTKSDIVSAATLPGVSVTVSV